MLGQIHDILGPDATVAKCAQLAVEAAPGIGVVKVDVLPVVHHELDLAERVGRPRRLAPALDLAVLPPDRDVAGLAGHLAGDARRHFPPRIEDHASGLDG